MQNKISGVEHSGRVTDMKYTDIDCDESVNVSRSRWINSKIDVEDTRYFQKYSHYETIGKC